MKNRKLKSFNHHDKEYWDTKCARLLNKENYKENYSKNTQIFLNVCTIFLERFLGHCMFKKYINYT